MEKLSLSGARGGGLDHLSLPGGAEDGLGDFGGSPVDEIIRFLDRENYVRGGEILLIRQ